MTFSPKPTITYNLPNVVDLGLARYELRRDLQRRNLLYSGEAAMFGIRPVDELWQAREDYALGRTTLEFFEQRVEWILGMRHERVAQYTKTDWLSDEGGTNAS